MADVSMAALLRTMQENPELFKAVTAAGTVEELGKILSAGAQSEIIQKKTVENTSEKTVETIRKNTVALAALFSVWVKESGTSKDRRLAIETEYGKFTLVLSKDQTPGRQS